MSELSADARRLCGSRFGLTEIQREGPLVPRDQVVALATALKEELHFSFFVACVATHYEAEVSPEGTELEPDRVVVLYLLRRLPDTMRQRRTECFQFRVIVPTGQSTPSLASIWAGADWQEREQFDLVGVIFDGHPDLRRIMMPEDWPGHPLRRDYAIETQHFPWR